MNRISNLYKGRLNRRNFLFGIFGSMMSLMIVFFALQTIEFLIHRVSGIDVPIALIAMPFLFVVLLVFSLSLHVRRWHDLGNSGFFVLLNFIPGVGALIVLSLFLMPGMTAKNKYGSVPPAAIRFPEDILGL